MLGLAWELGNNGVEGLLGGLYLWATHCAQVLGAALDNTHQRNCRN